MSTSVPLLALDDDHFDPAPDRDDQHRTDHDADPGVFFFNDPATNEIYTSSHTLSLHDALPIYARQSGLLDRRERAVREGATQFIAEFRRARSEEHTSELQSRELISYAVCC